MLKILFKVRLQSLMRSMFGRFFKPGAKPGQKLLIGLLVVYVVGALFMSVGMYFHLMAPALHAAGLDWLYFGLAALMSIALCFVGSVFITQSQLFYARDNELLLSMPIAPRHILTSRMLTLLGLHYLYTLMILGPAGVVYGMTVGFQAGPAAAFLVASLFSPFISLSLSCLFGWVIGLISSRLRRKNLVTVVLTVTFFLGYLYFFMNLQMFLNRLLASGAAIGQALRQALPPIYWFGAAAQGDWAALGLFLLCCIVPFALIYGVIARSYQGILTTQKGSVRIRYKAGAMKVRGAGGALLRRELLRFFGTPIYVFNSGIGAVMHLVLAVAALWKGPGLIQTLLGDTYGFQIGGLLAPAACLVVCFCTLMISTTSSSVSLEGKNLWIVQAAPVSARQIFAAKLGVHLLCALPSGLIASLALLWVLRPPLPEALGLLLLPAALGVFTALLGLSCNLLLPRLDWVSEAVVVKQSASALLSIFGGMAAVALPVLLYLTLLMGRIAAGAYLLICAAAFALLSAGLWAFVHTEGARRFERL